MLRTNHKQPQHHTCIQEHDGFSLIELLVVVLILGVLAAIAIPTYLQQQEKAFQAELDSSVRAVATELTSAGIASGGTMPALLVLSTDQTKVGYDKTTDTVTLLKDGLYNSGRVTMYYAPINTVTFGLCAVHTSLQTSNGVTQGVVEYVQSSGGVQPFDTTKTTCNVSPDGTSYIKIL